MSYFKISAQVADGWWRMSLRYVSPESDGQSIGRPITCPVKRDAVRSKYLV